MFGANQINAIAKEIQTNVLEPCQLLVSEKITVSELRCGSAKATNFEFVAVKQCHQIENGFSDCQRSVNAVCSEENECYIHTKEC